MNLMQTRSASPKWESLKTLLRFMTELLAIHISTVLQRFQGESTSVERLALGATIK